MATTKLSASSTTRAEGAAALAKASPVASAPPALSAAAKAHVASVTPIKKRAMTKPNVTWRYASRHESIGLVPGEYSRRRSADEYRVSGARGGYYRESRQWGGYYGDAAPEVVHMKTPLLIVLGAIVLMAGSGLAIMNNACKSNHHAWCAQMSDI